MEASDKRGELRDRQRGWRQMLTFGISLGLGIVVGCLYGLVRFKSPAPPPVALVGLAGIILGEWIVDLLRR